MVVTSRSIVSEGEEVATFKERAKGERPTYSPWKFKKIEGSQGGEWGFWRPGAQALTAQGVACLLQRSWRERAPNATWGPLPELCYVLKDGEAALWEWWPKHGSRGRI